MIIIGNGKQKIIRRSKNTNLIAMNCNFNLVLETSVFQTGFLNVIVYLGSIYDVGIV